MERVWPATVIEEGSLTVQVSALRRQLGEGADAMIVTVPRIGYRLITPPQALPRDQAGPPLIAVLPFANYGSTAQDGYFADGIVDDIITALSRFKSFGVMSRGSTVALRDKGGDARSAAHEFAVRYALEGSVRRMGKALRVTAQLLDATTGAQLWADRYDGSLADVFAFQDQITQRVVGVIAPTIRQVEIERARRRPAANVDAYDLHLRALPLLYAPGANGHVEALELLNRAAELDSTFALPRAYAALLYENRLSLREVPLGDNDVEVAVGLARAALDLGREDPLVRAICAFVLSRLRNDPAAVDALRGSVRDNPNNVEILTYAAGAVGMFGHLEESIDYHLRAYTLSPGSPEAYQNLFGIGACKFILGNYEGAIEWFLQSLSTLNDLIHTYVGLACCYTALDRMDSAYAMIRRVRELNQGLTIKTIEDGAADRQDAFAVAIVPWLRKAGFPET